MAESIRAPTRGPRRNPFETALAEAERQEATAGPPAELPFSATILCVGITGVGKTATIHSVLGLPPPGMGGFEPQTKQVSSHGFLGGVLAVSTWKLHNPFKPVCFSEPCPFAWNSTCAYFGLLDSL